MFSLLVKIFMGWRALTYIFSVHFSDLQVVSVVHVHATENTLSNMAYKDLVPCGTQRSYVRMGMSLLYIYIINPRCMCRSSRSVSVCLSVTKLAATYLVCESKVQRYKVPYGVPNYDLCGFHRKCSVCQFWHHLLIPTWTCNTAQYTSVLCQGLHRSPSRCFNHQHSPQESEAIL